MKKPRNLKCAVVGNHTVGKTCLLIRYTTDKYPDTYIPTVFENVQKTVEVDGQSYLMAFWDWNGSEEPDRLGPLGYPGTDIFLVCLSIVQPERFYKVKENWVPEISHYCPGTPFLLVGTQIDLRADDSTVEELAKNKQKPLSPKMGELLALDVGAVKYVECSALTGEGVSGVFHEAVLAALSKPEVTKRKNCCLL
jgi:cell division control protein 42